MAVHTPVHQRHVPHLRIDSDVLGVLVMGAAVLLIVVGFLLVPRLVSVPIQDGAEARSLVEFRAGERAAAVSEAESLIDFRAAERDMR